MADISSDVLVAVRVHEASTKLTRVDDVRHLDFAKCFFSPTHLSNAQLFYHRAVVALTLLFVLFPGAAVAMGHAFASKG